MQHETKHAGGAPAQAQWPPRPATPLEWCQRLLVGIGLALAATSFVMPPGDLGLGLALSALLSISVCALMELLGKRDAAVAEGTVTSKAKARSAR